ncbi:arylsulfatase B-like [Bacillus rossius redtenbacheri]|uniref:arylsulfatase B-like n=1 Tax=Bacillus rossius redtenbacheri TaxID=93214 RepID=UPI002FDD488C
MERGGGDAGDLPASAAPRDHSRLPPPAASAASRLQPPARRPPSARIRVPRPGAMACSAAVLSAVVLLAAASSAVAARPHIIMILADDLGWNDVGFHGAGQIATPNIDALAYNGVILDSHYTPALCTPSRAALMTGKYPTHTGMQHIVILAPEPWGLPLSEKLLPEHLREAGYSTHAVGKWHLGFFKKEYTPTHRGFDSHFGYWNGYQDYYDHTMADTTMRFAGLDMRRNMSADWGSTGRYATDLYADEAARLIRDHDPRRPLFLYLAHLAPHTGNPRRPFQAPDDEVARFAHVADPERRLYAAMVSRLDKSVGQVVAALRSKGMLENSVVVFMSDNGAPTFGIHSNRGSNWPLRGMKETPWEGGVRTAAAIWSPLLARTQRVSRQLMHMCDWLPTLYSAAGLDVANLGHIDGVDMWKALSEDLPSRRTEIVHNIDDIEGYAAIRRGDWKYIAGTSQNGQADGWYGETGREGPEYDVTEVLTSKTATSLAGVITELQIRQKNATKTGVTEDHGSESTDDAARRQWRVLTRSTLLELRKQAEVTCWKPVNKTTACDPLLAPCLFNIREDPCETNDLSQQEPLVRQELEATLEKYRRSTVQPLNTPGEARADPALWDHAWSPWRDDPPPAPRQSQALLLALVLLLVAAAGAGLLTAQTPLRCYKGALQQLLAWTAEQRGASGEQRARAKLQ